MTEYYVAQGWEKEAFIAHCQTLLSLGWMPQGGICVISDMTDSDAPILYAQAFVR